MAHELIKLTSKLCNTPQLITRESFETIFEYLDSRNLGMYRDDYNDKSGRTRFNYNEDCQVATMFIEGVTTYKPVTFWGMDCGGFSYEQWKEDFQYLAESGVKTVAFLQDSGGGEAHGLFDSAKHVRALADEYGVHLISFVDGLSASASYAISSIADEVVVTKGSQVGSIGCVVQLMNNSDQLKKEGLERKFITSADSKVPFAEDGSFKKEFLEDIQEKVDALGNQFVSFVSMNRGISEDTVRATQARTYTEDAALSLGLVDSVMSVEEFYTYLADSAQENKEGNKVKSMFNKQTVRAEEVDTHSQTIREIAPHDFAAELQGVQEQLTTMTEQYNSALAVAETLKASLDESQAELALMKQEKEEAKLSLRKSKLSAVLAEDKVEAMLASLSSLDDAAFETVVDGFSAQTKLVEASALMEEMGGGFDSEAEVTQAPEMSTTDLMIKRKLGLA